MNYTYIFRANLAFNLEASFIVYPVFIYQEFQFFKIVYGLVSVSSPFADATNSLMYTRLNSQQHKQKMLYHARYKLTMPTYVKSGLLDLVAVAKFQFEILQHLSLNYRNPSYRVFTV